MSHDHWLVDDRDRQASLDVGDAASRTEGREGQIWGSDSFADDRDSGSEPGEQFNLFSEEESLDGQASLGGGEATRESGGFFDLSGSDSGGSGAAFETSADVGSLFESAFGTPDQPPDGGALDSIGGNIRAAERAGALSPEPNGDAQQAPDGLFARSNGGGNRSRKRQVDVQSLDSAGDIRERYDEFLHPDDHRGRTTVQFVGDVPDGVVRQARAVADEVAAERSRSQTVDLGEGTRQQIKDLGGFDKRTTTANWKSARGVFAREGLSDQFGDAIAALTDYDDPIEGAEEWVQRHKQRQAESRVGGVGAMDVGETDIKQRQRTGRAAAREQQSLEASAIEGAKRGHQEAVDALVFEAGWDRAEAEALGQQVDDPTSSMTEPEFQRIVETEIKRSRSSGRFAAARTQDGPPGVDRRRSSGRFISSPLADTNIRRDSQTGRFRGGGSE